MYCWYLLLSGSIRWTRSWLGIFVHRHSPICVLLVDWNKLPIDFPCVRPLGCDCPHCAHFVVAVVGLDLGGVLEEEEEDAE